MRIHDTQIGLIITSRVLCYTKKQPCYGLPFSVRTGKADGWLRGDVRISDEAPFSAVIFSASNLNVTLHLVDA